MNIKKIIWIVSALVLIATPAVAGQGKGKGKGNAGNASKDMKATQPAQSKASDNSKAKGPEPKGGVSVSVALTIGASEKSVIQGYVKNHHKPGVAGGGLPPGLAKKVAAGGDLPPGWQKKCIVGEIMPLVVFKQCHPLPMEIQVKLPQAPPDTTLVAIDGRVYRVHKKTHKIHGVFVVDL